MRVDVIDEILDCLFVGHDSNDGRESVPSALADGQTLNYELCS